MGCTLGPISGPRAEVDLPLHPFIIHPSNEAVLKNNIQLSIIHNNMPQILEVDNGQQAVGSF
jgi:hypothetical protein